MNEFLSIGTPSTVALPHRIVHIHVPKTAGTALRTAFQQHYGEGLRIFPHYDERLYAGVNPNDYDFYSGHIGFRTASQLDGDMITILRNPVDRYISVYYFWRELYRKGVDTSRKTRLATRYSLDEFVLIKDDPIIAEEFENRVTFQLAHGSAVEHRDELHDMVLSEDEIFRMAIKNLSQLKAIGLQERMGEFKTKIAKLFNINLPIEKTNVTEQRAMVSDISIRTLKNIHERTYMDIELYSYASQLAQDL